VGAFTHEQAIASFYQDFFRKGLPFFLSAYNIYKIIVMRPDVKPVIVKRTLIFSQQQVIDLEPLYRWMFLYEIKKNSACCYGFL
jgi:hypothetical protein